MTDILITLNSGGEKGDSGLPGPRGERGPQGSQGPRGQQGVQGLRGPQGTGLTLLGSVPSEADLPLSGNVGDAYFIGDEIYIYVNNIYQNYGPVRGPQGIQGPAGQDGEDGATGPQGPIGLTGAQGEPGPQGDIGPQGLQGDRGPEGPVGLTGPQGTPGSISQAWAGPWAAGVSYEVGDMVRVDWTVGNNTTYALLLCETAHLAAVGNFPSAATYPTNWSLITQLRDGANGINGQSATFTIFSDEAVFNMHTAGPLEMVFLVDA